MLPADNRVWFRSIGKAKVRLMNSLRQLTELGQSVWLDYIRRDLITSGQLKRLIEEDGVSGITSNPTIFEKALSSGRDYDTAIESILSHSPDLDSVRLYESIEVKDVQMAADALAAVYDRSRGNDGFVSIEVSPHVAYNTARSISEARRLWAEVNRKNLMVKIPATGEGLPAIEQLLRDGINVNITLLFSVSQYEAVAQTYLRAMEHNHQPQAVTSVASFFVSRVDTAVDRALEEIGTPEALALRGKAGIANARLAYKRFRQIFLGPQFERLKARGVRIQKPLWASTSTKNKAYSDVMYIEGLAGPHTIDSMPPATLQAFRDHGKSRLALGESEDDAKDVVGSLVGMAINLSSVGLELTEEGVDKFMAGYDHAIQALEQKRATLAKV
jgi:transaldolase